MGKRSGFAGEIPGGAGVVGQHPRPHAHKPRPFDGGSSPTPSETWGGAKALRARFMKSPLPSVAVALPQPPVRRPPGHARPVFFPSRALSACVHGTDSFDSALTISAVGAAYPHGSDERLARPIPVILHVRRSPRDAIGVTAGPDPQPRVREREKRRYMR